MPYYSCVFLQLFSEKLNQLLLRITLYLSDNIYFFRFRCNDKFKKNYEVVFVLNKIDKRLQLKISTFCFAVYCF